MNDRSNGTRETLRVQLGERILRARNRHRWSQATLAERMGISQSQLSKIERGDRELSFLDLVALAAQFGLPLQFFLDGGLTPSRSSQGFAPELAAYGIVDLQSGSSLQSVGAFRSVEEVLCQSTVGSAHPRVFEALPILPLCNTIRSEILVGFARHYGVLRSVAFICDVALHLRDHAEWPRPSKVQLDDVEVDGFLREAKDLAAKNPQIQPPQNGGKTRLARKWRVAVELSLAEFEARCIALSQEGVR